VNLPPPQCLVTLIDSYPKLNGEICLGGAETNLERLMRFISENYGQEMKSTVFILRGTPQIEDPYLNQESPETRIIKIGSLRKAVNFLIQHQNRVSVFYCADKTLYFRPHLFLKLLHQFKKPILLRVTSSKYLDFLKSIPHWIRLLLSRFFFRGREDIYVIALSRACHDGLVALGVNPERIVALPNAVDLAKYRPPEDLPCARNLRSQLFSEMPDDACLFIYVGRIIGWHKRVDFLLQAWQESRLSESGHRLLLVGSPKNDFFIKDGIKIWKQHGPIDSSSGPGKTRGTFWTGFVEMEALPPYLWASDVFVLPSDFEGMSNAAIEALAAGLPILGRKAVSGNEELIDSHLTGLLFADRQEFVSQLQWMARPENRSGMREAALKKARDFSVEVMCDRYVKLLWRMTRAPKESS